MQELDSLRDFSAYSADLKHISLIPLFQKQLCCYLNVIAGSLLDSQPPALFIELFSVFHRAPDVNLLHIYQSKCVFHFFNLELPRDGILVAKIFHAFKNSKTICDESRGIHFVIYLPFDFNQKNCKAEGKGIYSS